MTLVRSYPTSEVRGGIQGELPSVPGWGGSQESYPMSEAKGVS